MKKLFGLTLALSVILSFSSVSVLAANNEAPPTLDKILKTRGAANSETAKARADRLKKLAEEQKKEEKKEE